MKINEIVNISRRRLIISSLGVGTGLTLGMYLTACGKKNEQDSAPQSTSSSGPGKTGEQIVNNFDFSPNAFVKINTDNTVTVIIKHLEMGQGTYTGIATLVAEELDATWEQVMVEGAPADAKVYNNLFWGPMQGTGGSTAIANSFNQMRKAGGVARHMLVTAAAELWNVAVDEISVNAGLVGHTPSNKSASFGELAQLAAKQTVPEEVFLKEPEDFKLIGKNLSRKDNNDKVFGKAVYTQDIQLPGMLTALVAHPPGFGATLKSVDSSKAKAIKGVVDVLTIPSGVAVVANNFWSAKQGRDVLKIEWDEEKAFKLDSDEILANFRELASTPGTIARQEGDISKAKDGNTQIHEASYQFPYLAHAAMEPMNCVIQLTDNGAEVWNGEQFQTIDQQAVANTLGIQPEQVKINMLYAGGSFGRRANPHADFVKEAATIVKAMQTKSPGSNKPIKMVWTREDDMHSGYYRPMYYHSIKAGTKKDGTIVSWEHRIVGQSIISGTAFEDGMIKDGVDSTSVEGAANMPYAIPNITVDLHSPKLPVPVQWWRSVGSTHTAFAVETFIDELATKGDKDPLEFRRGLLKNHPRHLGVLELAAQKANWDKSLPQGSGRGIAVHESFNSFVAQVAEITVKDDKTFSVDRVVIAVDCGIAVNPDIIRAQMEGGMGFGLSAVLTSKLSLKQGKVEQSNFHDYTVLRINQMPEVEVHIVNSVLPPTGVGEPATPVIAPAVANALHQITGRRYYQLPLGESV